MRDQFNKKFLLLLPALLCLLLAFLHRAEAAKDDDVTLIYRPREGESDNSPQKLTKQKGSSLKNSGNFVHLSRMDSTPSRLWPLINKSKSNRFAAIPFKTMFPFHISNGETEKKSAVSSTNRQRRKVQLLLYPEAVTKNIEPNRVNKSCRCGFYNKPQTRIVKGKETDPRQYPWMVSIQFIGSDLHFCGGSIISDWYVITAAHCTDGLSAEDLHVKVGDHDVTKDDQRGERYIKVDEIKQHKGYNPKNTNNDIALLKLRKAFKLNQWVNPICLTPPDLTFYKEKMTVMGWGKKNSYHSKGSPTLRETQVQIISMDSCRRDNGFKAAQITSKMFCAKGETTKGVPTDACQGDSGGPAVWRDETQDRYFIIGVVSWGIGCADPKYPGVYTKVMKFLEWIYENTEDSNFCESFKPHPTRTKTKAKANLSKGKWNNKSKSKGKGKGKNKVKGKRKNLLNRKEKSKAKGKRKNKVEGNEMSKKKKD